MPVAGGEVFDLAFWSGLEPERGLTVSQWAEENRWLSTRASAEHGQWRNARTPYLVEVMDSLSASSEVETVVMMTGAQVGKTESGNNWLGYVIHHAPAPMLIVLPTVELAKRHSRQKLEPMIEDCPALRARVRPARARDSGNTVLSKEFPGGIMVLTGANSAAGLRQMSCRYQFLDEIDGYPGDVEGEGDPIELAAARSRTFARRKRLLTSTPTFTGRSRIEALYEATDQRHFHLPCPYCGHFQVLRWSNLRWDKGQPDTVVYGCEECGTAIEERWKTQMLARGRWIADKADRDPRVRGYHLSSLYSPLGWYSWRHAVQEWEAAQGKPDRLRVFVNTVLGETWKQTGDAPPWERLYNRRETYERGKVPERGLVLTAGVDVQADRLECEIVAWGRDMESWSIEYLVFPGDTNLDDVWRRLDETLARTWPHERGAALPLRMVGVDSGYNTTAVYRWCRGKEGRVLALKGRGDYPAIVGQPQAVEVAQHGKRIRRGARVWPVGVGIIKSELYQWLKVELPADVSQGYPPGWCHFPEYGEEFFLQLTAEELQFPVIRGYRRPQWEKVRERNEALDCRTYARAAAHVLGLDRYRPEHWAKVEAALGVAPPVRPRQDPPPAASVSPPTAPRPRRPREGGGFLDRWRQ